jgi:DNA-binding FadR family transcriptional regulator
MFEKVEQSRVSQGIVIQLEEAIVAGKFKPGEKLPPERELKETFQVGRGAVREALRVLEQKGLLEIRLGVHGGAIVTRPSTEPMLETLSLLVKRKKIPFRDIQEFRSTVESRIAALAAQRATKEDVQRLHLIVEQCRYYLETRPNWDKFLQEDGKFHKELAAIAHNQMFALIADALHRNIHTYYTTRLEKTDEILEMNIQDLDAIFQAVKRRDAVQAEEAMHQHIIRFDSYMARKQGEMK